MKEHQLVNTKEAAKLLGVSTRTLCEWRIRRKGPPYCDLSAGKGKQACIRYSLKDLQKWIKENTIRTGDS